MMEQAGIVEQSDGKDFKAGVFGKWRRMVMRGHEAPPAPPGPLV